MDLNDRLNIGMVGAGIIANIHIEQFKQFPDVYISAITDVNLDLAETRAKEHGIPTVYRTAEELLNDTGIDAVIIGVPNKYHASLAIQALQAGKHVLLEKPMAINLESAKEIMRAHDASNKVLMIPHQFRWESLSMQIKEQADQGNFGQIYNAKAGWFRRKGIPGWGTWFTRQSESGGGPLIDVGVHLLDLALHLMGDPKPVAVFGSTYAEFGPDRRGIGNWGIPNWKGHFDVEDLASALIKFDNGSTLSLEVSWAAHTDIENNGAFIHLMGSQGGASLRSMSTGKLFLEAFDRAVDIDLAHPAEDADARYRLSRHFIDCIREGKEPITTARTGFVNNVIIDAIYESSRTGKLIELNFDY